MIIKDRNYTPDTQADEGSELNFGGPIGKHESPDPFITYDGERGLYYLLFTRGREIRIFYSDSLLSLRDSDSVCVYSVERGDGIYGCIWAPEMHFVQGRWYIYTSGARTADGREDRTLFILVSKTENPLDGFDFAAYPDPSLHAIDPTVFTHNGSLYMCYAREGGGNRINIRKMSSPTEFSGQGVQICQAELPWETVPPYVGESTIVEGPFAVKSPDGKRLFIIYSANGCWSDDYAFGVLELKGSDPMDSASWEKDPEILMKKGNGVFGPGHASFFYAPGTKDLCIAYHGMLESNKTVTWAPRFLFVQRVYFDNTGYPCIESPRARIPEGDSIVP